MALTPEQLKEHERFKRYIEREQIVCVMNNTKWKRLFDLCVAQRLGEFRRKDVRGEEPNLNIWTRDIYYIFAGWDRIEWLDIKTIYSFQQYALVEPETRDDTEKIRALLGTANVPYCLHNGYIRNWGCLRPGVNPDWCDR